MFAKYYLSYNIGLSDIMCCLTEAKGEVTMTQTKTSHAVS